MDAEKCFESIAAGSQGPCELKPTANPAYSMPVVLGGPQKCRGLFFSIS